MTLGMTNVANQQQQLKLFKLKNKQCTNRRCPTLPVVVIMATATAETAKWTCLFFFFY